MNISVNEFFPNGNQSVILSRAFNVTEEYYRNLKRLLKIKRVKGHNLVRIGRENDGGYIMVDNFLQGGGVAYSFGISNEISWDEDMARRGYDVYMYDMTIDGLPYENEKFHFFREGIAGRTIPEKSLDTLENFVARNGHVNNDKMILKMDVEGAEWDFFANVSPNLLSQFDQLVFEIHDLIRPRSFGEMEFIFQTLRKLTLNHTLVHVHGNHGGGRFLVLENIGVFPALLELSYVKTANYDCYDDENILLPLPIDYPNMKGRQDIPLGYWNKFE